VDLFFGVSAGDARMKLRPEFGLQHAPAGLYMGYECTLGTLRRHHENKLPAMFILVSPFSAGILGMTIACDTQSAF
jgi:hypothetical protein